MRILLLTFYYPPDLSAGSYRAAALAEALVQKQGDLDLEVLTTMPNRYSRYRCVEDVPRGVSVESPQLSVNRIPVRHHQSRLLDQSFAFSGFAARVLRETHGKQYDIVVATSSRLFTGLLGTLVAERTGARLYLDIRDLFIDNLGDMFRLKPVMAPVLPGLSLLERHALRRAARVNVVSESFLDYCRSRLPQGRFSTFGNGIDEEFLAYDFRKQSTGGRKVVLYAGNIGLGQGLENVVPEAAQLLGEGYELRIIGDGGQRPVLERRLRDRGAENVELLAPMSREALMREYRKADYLFLHLNAFRSMEKVLPSKIFEYAATGKPLVAGVAGHARNFVETNVDHAAVFEPGDAPGMVDAVRSLSPVHAQRAEFRESFSRTRIMRQMASDVLDVL